MLAAEHVAEALGGGPRQRRTRELRRRPGATATSAATCGRCATPSRCGRSSARSWASPRAASTCGATRSASRSFGTLGHGKADADTLKPAAECQPIAYPKPDGKLTFDRLSSVFLSNTNHEEDQPPHLHVADMALQKASEHDVYAGPSARYCPAGVYEWVEEGGQAALRDQRAELRPLQNLRHQGSQPQHHLGAAGGRRRTEIFQYVRDGSATRSRYRHTAILLVRRRRRGIPLLAGGTQKGHSAPDSKGWRTAAHGGSHS